jgi:polyisoprenoid-binding protein YceI
MRTTRASWLAVTLVAAAITVVAAERVRFAAAPGSFVKVSGTSTVHDWTVEAKAIDGWIDLAPQELTAGQVSAAPMKVTIKVADLKSGKGSMDQVMYKALKGEKNPSITYEMVSSSMLGTSDLAKGKLNFQTKGKLTVAGKMREITMPVTVQLKGNAVEITGSTPLKMTSFDMKPPTAMLGTIKSSDDIKVNFHWIVKQK